MPDSTGQSGAEAPVGDRRFMRELMRQSGGEAFTQMRDSAPAHKGTRLTPGPGGLVLGEDFFGLTTDGRLVKDLFPVYSTGVSTKPIVAAAVAFLDSLDQAHRAAVHFGIHAHEWRQWSNIEEFDRQGVKLADMTAQQREAGHAMTAASLSAKGLELSDSIRFLNHAAGELTGHPELFNEDEYFYTVMGEPSETEPWGWQFEGHHLVINCFVLGDQVVMTPCFWGSEPLHAETGKYAGVRVFDAEIAQARAVLDSLSPAQRAAATISSPKMPVNNVVAGRNLPTQSRDNRILPYTGVSAAALNAGQRAELVKLIRLFVGNIRDGHAMEKMTEVLGHLAETHFAWIGTAEHGTAFYFRVQSPVIFIEFDNPPPGPVGRALGDPHEASPKHVHAVVRTPNGNDYGKALLQHHLATSPHHRSVVSTLPRLMKSSARTLQRRFGA